MALKEEKQRRNSIHAVLANVINANPAPNFVDSIALVYTNDVEVPSRDLPGLINALGRWIESDLCQEKLFLQQAIQKLKEQLEEEKAPSTDDIEGYLQFVLDRRRKIHGIVRSEWITAETLARVALMVGNTCEGAGMFLTDLAGERIFLYSDAGKEVIFGLELNNPANSDDPLFFLAEHHYGIFGPYEDRETALLVLRSLWPNALKID